MTTYESRVQFVPTDLLTVAKNQCPWAAYFLEGLMGYWCFATREDMHRHMYFV